MSACTTTAPAPVINGCPNLHQIDLTLPDFSSIHQKFNLNKVSFIATDWSTNTCWTTNPSNITQRHSPWSTFKIPNSLIALEEGKIEHVDEIIEWNKHRYPSQDFWPKSWEQNHTLKSAFKHSVVWFYRVLASRISNDTYNKWFAQFQYGNQTMQPDSDYFWLGTDFAISPAEQVVFLNCLTDSGCGLSKKTISTFEEIALQEKTPQYTLYAKTGAGPVQTEDNNTFGGWYVGYIRNTQSEAVVTFALYMQAKEYADLKTARKQVALALLSQLNFWAQ